MKTDLSMSNLQTLQKEYDQLLGCLSPSKELIDIPGMAYYHHLIGTVLINEFGPSSAYPMAIKSLARFEADHLLYSNTLLGYVSERGNLQKKVDQKLPVFELEQVRLETLNTIYLIENYISEIDYDRVYSLLGRVVNLFDSSLPQIGPKGVVLSDTETLKLFYGGRSVNHILYRGTRDESNWYFYDESPIYIHDPSVMLRVFQLFRQYNLLNIKTRDVSKLVRIIFDFENKFKPKYPFEIPKFEIKNAKVFSNDLRYALKLFKQRGLIEGKTKDLATIISRVFNIDGLSPRTIENAMRSSVQLSLKSCSQSEFLSVCQFSTSSDTPLSMTQLQKIINS